MTHQFRKLNVDLPRQPLSDQKVWAVIGWVLAAIVILIMVVSYINYVNDQSSVQTKSFENNISFNSTSTLNIQPSDG